MFEEMKHVMTLDSPPLFSACHNSSITSLKRPHQRCSWRLWSMYRKLNSQWPHFTKLDSGIPPSSKKNMTLPLGRRQKKGSGTLSHFQYKKLFWNSPTKPPHISIGNE